MNIQEHPLIDSCFVFKSEYGKQYMLEKVNHVIKDLVWNKFYYKPAYVNLARVIKYIVGDDGIFLVTHYYDEVLSELEHNQVHLFFIDLFNIVEYLADNNIFHEEMWNRHNIWIHNNRFHIKPFDYKPSTVDKTQIITRCLRDVFILAFNLLFGFEKTNFTLLEKFINENMKARRYVKLYNEIKNFTSFSRLHNLLTKPFDPTSFFQKDYNVVLSEKPATKVLQEVVLRSFSVLEEK